MRPQVLLLLLLPLPVFALDLPQSPTPAALSTWQLPPSTVKGQKPQKQHAQLDSTAAANVLTGDELRERHLSVPEALDAEAGLKVHSLSGFGAPAQLSIRGCTSDQMQVVIDEVPLQSLDGTPLDLADLPAGQIERLEIYRGATPVTLGSQAIGGTLRLTLRQPEEMGGEINAGIGSYGARQAEAAAGWHQSALRLSAGLRYLHSDGDFPYRFDNGTLYTQSDDATHIRRNNAVDRLGGTLGAQWIFNDHWQLQARWLGAGLSQGIPGPAIFEAPDPFLKRNRQLAALSLVGKHVWQEEDELRVTLQGSWLGTEVNDIQGELGVPLQTNQTVRTLGLQTVWQTPLTGPLGLVARLAAMAGDVNNRDLLQNLDQPTSTRQALQGGLATPLNWKSLGLQVIPSVSLEGQHSRRTTDVGYPFTVREVNVEQNTLWTTRLASAWQALEWLQARAAWTRGMRAPSLSELYGNDGVIQGNPLLLPETAMTWDAGLLAKHTAEKWAVDAEISAFWQNVDQLIQLESVTAHSARYANIASAQLLGVEAQLSLRLFKQLQLTGQHTSLVTQDTSGRVGYTGNVLPMRPRTRWSLRADWSRRTGPLAWRPFVATQWQAGHFLDAANLVVVPGHFLLGGGLRVEHKPWQVYAEVRVDNALDAPVVDLVGYPLPGRTFWLQIGWRMWRDEEQNAETKP